jgi:chemotaxis protein CheC
MPDNLSHVNPAQIDAFREIGNIGAGNAVTALSDILGRRIVMEIPDVAVVPFGSIVDALDGPEMPVAGVLVGISGDLDGYMLLILRLEDAHKIASCAIGAAGPPAAAERSAAEPAAPQLGEMERSAVTEIANILTGAFLTAVGAQTGLEVRPTVPHMAVDMMGAIISVAIVDYGMIGDSVLLLKTRFSDNDMNVNGHFFLIPDYKSYRTLINSLGL